MSSIAARRANKRACPLQPNGILFRGTHVYPGANEGVGGVHPKETGFCQRRHDRLGEAALLLGLIGLGSNQGFKGAHSVEQPVERMSVRCGHRAPPYMWASEVRPVLRCVCVCRRVGRSSHSDRVDFDSKVYYLTQ